MVEVLNKLREIEADVIQHSASEGEPHIGSIKFLGTKGKALDARGFPPVTGAGGRPANRRIPSFGMGVQIGQARSVSTEATSSTFESPQPDELKPPGGTGPLPNGNHTDGNGKDAADTGRPSVEDPSEDEEDEELEAILALNGVDIHAAEAKQATSGHSNGDGEMSWRLTGWMKEYLDKIKPGGSVLTPAAVTETSGTLIPSSNCDAP